MSNKPDDVSFQEELDKMEYEPLSPIEIKLCRNSFILGIVLLVVFYFVADIFFPGAHG